VLRTAMQTVQPAILADMTRANVRGAGQGILDAYQEQLVLSGVYTADAAAIAQQIMEPAASQIAVDVAREWLNRPWPYEITPPDGPVPPVRGIGPEERKILYSVVAASRQGESTAPRTILPTLFRTDESKLIAYAQAEMFSFSEFDPQFGGGARYDQVTRINEIVYRVGTARFTGVFPAPRAWRVATIGGWQWRARLSLSDALVPFHDPHPREALSLLYDPSGRTDYALFDQNSELRQYFNDAGIDNPNAGGLREINLH
jgi:hypothetical protein